MIDRRQFLSVSAAALGLPSSVLAQTAWPTRPVRVVIPYAAGGVTDSVGRKLAEHLGQQLGQALVVENKGGAGGTLGMADVARATADGYTLALSAISPLTLSPHLGKLPYDPFKDIVAVAPMMYSPVYVLGTSALSATSWQALLARAKAQPGSIRMATSGMGSVGHIMLEQIQAQTGARFTHIPYKGVGQTVNDAAGGHFEVMLGNPFGTINGLIEQGRLRVLATTGPQRAPNQPQVPTLAELGVPAANLTSLFGFMAPAGTPPEIVARLNQEVQRALAAADVQHTLRSTDNVALHHSPQEFAALLQQESRNNAAIIRQANIQL